jgi:hypothetical protein
VYCFIVNLLSSIDGLDPSLQMLLVYFLKLSNEGVSQ